MHLAQLNINSPSTVFTTSSYSSIVGLAVGRILLYAIPIAGFYFFIRFVIAGYGYMTSLGDPAKVQSAQQQIVNALFGLVIVVTAFFLAQIAETILGIDII